MKPALAIFLVALAAYALTGGGHLFTSDEEILFRATRALATGPGMLIRPLASGFATVPPQPPRPDGLEHSQYGIGQPLLAVPFYWLGAWAARHGSDGFWRELYGQPVFSPRTLEYEPVARELAPRFVMSWFNALFGAMLAAALFLLCFELTADTRASAWAALLYALGSLAWPHARPFFSEIATTLFVLLAWLGLLRAKGPRAAGWCLFAGLMAGYALLIRQDAILAYPALGLLALGPVVKGCRERGRPVWPAWLAFGLPLALAMAVWLGLNAWRFGGIFEFGHKDQPEGIHFSTPLLVGLYGLTLSVGRGLFLFSPALIPGCWGWGPLVRLTRARHGAIVWALALGILLPLCFHAKWQNFAGGWTWGPRHIFMIHPFLAVPIAGLLARHWNPVTRMAALIFLLIGMSVQVIGCSQDFIAFYTSYYRAPGDARAFFVMYDDLDQAYWGNHYQLMFRRDPGEAFRAVPLYPPPPIQDSLFVPARSVWAGYPRLMRENGWDNFWLRTFRR